MLLDPLHLPADLRARLDAYARLLWDWNAKINLIARTTPPDEVYSRHVLHCLALAQRPFPDGAHVADFGTGGGLPGLVLATVFPAVTFHLVDSTQKKVRAVEAMAADLGLANVRTYAVRAEDWRGKAHYAVSRATAPLLDLWAWHLRARLPLTPPADAWPPGLLALKGGDLRAETATLHLRYPGLVVATQPLEPVLGHPHFADKVVVRVQKTG